jgi:hypothetical protein
MGGFITQRLGTYGRGYASMIVSNNNAGGGSTGRLYKFLLNNTNISPQNFFFEYLGGNRSTTAEFNRFYMSHNMR